MPDKNQPDGQKELYPRMFQNPFRPGAGHMPPHLAGRLAEREKFKSLLTQSVITSNPVLTGLRGVGKTVLAETFKPLAQSHRWLWVGTDLSESASVTEGNLLTRLITDLAIVTGEFTVMVEPGSGPTTEHALDFNFLMDFCNQTPGLMSDKLRAVLELVNTALPTEYSGIIFAYDEAQNLSDQAADKEYPLSLLLEVFQAVQRKGIPFMLMLTGLPTLFPKMVEARTYAERMFTIMTLSRLSDQESEDAITRPIETAGAAPKFSPESIKLIRQRSGGYPYFIQFICREVFDVFIQQRQRGERMYVPIDGIIKKLDTDFFSGRWGNTTERQRELMLLIAYIDDCATEFSVKQIVDASNDHPSIKPFGASHVNQLLASLADLGLVYKNGYGRYAFAVPMMSDFIKRQTDSIL